MEIKCLLCSDMKEAQEIICLKCNHSFCLDCINKYMQTNLNIKMKCPTNRCDKIIQDRIVRAVLPDEFISKYENLIIRKMDKNYDCLLPECPSVVTCNENDVQFECIRCNLYNCIRCKAAHRYLSCAEYKSNKDSSTFCQDEITRARNILKNKRLKENREEMVEMESVDLFTNNEIFQCSICSFSIGKGKGVLLRCSHNYCRNCLKESINNSSIVPVKCAECNTIIEDREVAQILTAAELSNYAHKCNQKSSTKFAKSFHCQTPDCPYFVILDGNPKTVQCQLCKAINCTSCRTIHGGETCLQYQNRAENLLKKKLIKEKKLMECLKCHQSITKIKGCNWIKCDNCQTELCWITQNYRWGPKGRYDTSEGCKCGVGGKRCHPDCLNGCSPHPGH